jgi:DNA-binding protein HU-beta
LKRLRAAHHRRGRLKFGPGSAFALRIFFSNHSPKKEPPVLNKTDLIAAIANDTQLSKADAARALDAAIDNLSRALAGGDTVQLIGFGTFAVSSRPERTGRNPSTGEPMTIKASKAPKFTAGKALKDAVNTTPAQ